VQEKRNEIFFSNSENHTSYRATSSRKVGHPDQESRVSMRTGSKPKSTSYRPAGGQPRQQVHRTSTRSRQAKKSCVVITAINWDITPKTVIMPKRETAITKDSLTPPEDRKGKHLRLRPKSLGETPISRETSSRWKKEQLLSSRYHQYHIQGSRDLDFSNLGNGTDTLSPNVGKV
jgi:hypothetical protein